VNYIDLFHGIGGFALGAVWAGMKFENHFCSDIEPYCQKLYKLRFPDSVQLGDITKIDTEELKKYGTDWIITGGFPCQDISIAGKGAGITGARSGLWFEYWRLIRDLRPRFAIMENVGMLVHRGLREVLGSLAEIGYDAEWQDIRASDMGAPHRRERIWIVAYSSCIGRRGRDNGNEGGMCWTLQAAGSCSDDQSGILADSRLSESSGRDEDAERGERETCSQSTSCGIVTNTERDDIGAGLCEDEPTEQWRGRPCDGDSKRTVSDTESMRLQGERPVYEQITDSRCSETEFEGCGNGGGNYWSTEPAVGRLAHGIPSRVDRLKGLGNAIVPQIAELLFRQIKPYIKGE
jgi:DNA (cytosine-5)-methyltransferase 1